jgi:transposase
MSLDEQIAAFLSEAGARPPRSKLEPYAELIRELRQRRWTYRKIAAALGERFGVSASPSTIHDYIRVRARRQGLRKPGSQPESPQPPPIPPVAPKRRFRLEM